MKTLLVLLATAVIAVPLSAHVRLLVQDGGIPLRRTDAGNIRFLVNDQTQPGLMNADGRTVITAGSDPMATLQASADRWSAVSSAMIQFAQLPTTPLSGDGQDGNHVITFQDTPAIRSIVGGALAVTPYLFTPANGNITDSDILFNPNIMVNGQHFPFSTNLAPNSFDLGSIATHELGHALGAAHSGVLAAAMFPRTPPESNLNATLSSDDLAFAREVYPAPNVATDFGYIEGRITRQGGGVARRVLVAAHGELNGVVVCTLTNTTDGGYRIGPLPAGNYFLSAEPLDGPVMPADFPSLNQASFDTDVKVWFLGAPEPDLTAVAGGQTATADFAVGVGAPTVGINRIGKGPAGSPGNFRDFGAGAIEVDQMSSFDLVMDGPGIDGNLNDNFIALLGPSLNIRPGSLVVDPFVQGITLVRVTIDVGPVVGRQLSTIALISGTEFTALSGAIVINGGNQPGPIFTSAGLGNGASFAVGAVAPEEIVTLFGENLATQQASAPEPLPFEVAGTRIEVRDSQGDSRNAGISFAHPLQLNFVIPRDIAPGPGTLILHTAQGSASIAIQIENVAPGVFTPNGTGTGVAFAQRWLFNNDFSQLLDITNAYQLNGAVFVPAPIDLGPQNQQPVLVLAVTGLRRGSVVTATIDGEPAQVLGFAAQGQFTGLDQVNILLNRNLAGRGQVTVVLTVDGKATNATVVSFQ